MTDILKLFVSGFSGGLFYGIALKTGLDISPEGLSLLVGSKTCEAIPSANSMCASYLRMVSLGSSVGTIGSLLTILAGIWKGSVKAITFALGFLVGVMVVIQ